MKLRRLAWDEPAPEDLLDGWLEDQLADDTPTA
jgi:hypothetical protein